jgi:hypothetical protein
MQGDLRSAAELFDKAVESAGAFSPSAMWQFYYDRGKFKMEQGRLQEAFADFGAALKSARQWRAEVLPADSFRIGTEVKLQQVYSSFIEVGSRLYAKTSQTRYVEQAFAAARPSCKLRALWVGRDLTTALPGECWEALADLNKLEAGWSPVMRPTCRPSGVAAKVEEMETRAALACPGERVIRIRSTPAFWNVRGRLSAHGSLPGISPGRDRVVPLGDHA